jgi:hypothetical protein
VTCYIRDAGSVLVEAYCMDMRKGTLIENMSHPKEELSDHLEYNCEGTPSEFRLDITSVALIIRRSQQEQYTVYDFSGLMLTILILTTNYPFCNYRYFLP